MRWDKGSADWHGKGWHDQSSMPRHAECELVIVDGKLFDHYFRMPILCNFVLGHAKENIVNNVSIDTPEVKAKDFCRMVKDV